MELTLVASEPSLLRGDVARETRKMVLHLMAGRTKCDQVVECIVAEFTALRKMMYVQVFRRPAILTPPTISIEHSMTK